MTPNQTQAKLTNHQLIKLLWCLPGQATADCRADVRGHQPGPCEEDGHHREPPAPSSTCHVLCPPLQVRKTQGDQTKLPSLVAAIVCEL